MINLKYCFTALYAELKSENKTKVRFNNEEGFKQIAQRKYN